MHSQPERKAGRAAGDGHAGPPARRAPRAGLHSLGWRPAEDLTLADWVEHGRRLGRAGRSAGWWIGDWLHFGNQKYGERYARAARITGYDVQTLMNMVHVARHVDASRRREKLSWSHHVEVAPLPPDAQDHWLDRAEAEGMSVRDLREAIRAAREPRPAAVAATAGEPPSREPPPSHEPHGEHRVCPSCGTTLD